MLQFGLPPVGGHWPDDAVGDFVPIVPPPHVVYPEGLIGAPGVLGPEDFAFLLADVGPEVPALRHVELPPLPMAPAAVRVEPPLHIQPADGVYLELAPVAHFIHHDPVPMEAVPAAPFIPHDPMEAAPVAPFIHHAPAPMEAAPDHDPAPMALRECTPPQNLSEARVCKISFRFNL